MNTFGLIGEKLTHSFSKKYFENKFRELGIDKENQYLLFELKEITEFPELIEKHPNLKGLNVTIPYKLEVKKYIDKLDESAEQVGAVNVIEFDSNKKLIGHNSDLYGFLESIKPLIDFNKKNKALILGTGGASLAVLAAFKHLNIPYQLVSRGKKSNCIDYDEANKQINEYSIIVNCTPLGTYPDVEICPPIDYSQLNQNYLLYDLVYNPDETLFLKKGKEKGCKIKNGLEMLELQAERSWQIWTNKK